MLPLFAFLILVLVLMLLALKYDASSDRLGHLAINGELKSHLQILKAQSYLNRRLGLLNHVGLPREFGLWLANTTRIHTRAMLFPIDIVFLDRKGKVLAIFCHVLPNRKDVFAAPFALGGTAIELCAGVTKDFLRLNIGDTVEFKKI